MKVFGRRSLNYSYYYSNSFSSYFAIPDDLEQIRAGRAYATDGARLFPHYFRLYWKYFP